MLNKSTDYYIYNSDNYTEEEEYDISTIDYEDAKELIDNIMTHGLVAIGSLNHKYAGYANYSNIYKQPLGFYADIYDFCESHAKYADYRFAFKRYGNRLFVEYANHDYSTVIELRQATELAYEMDNNYIDMTDYPLADSLYSYHYFIERF